MLRETCATVATFSLNNAALTRATYPMVPIGPEKIGSYEGTFSRIKLTGRQWIPQDPGTHYDIINISIQRRFDDIIKLDLETSDP